MHGRAVPGSRICFGGTSGSAVMCEAACMHGRHKHRHSSWIHGTYSARGPLAVGYCPLPKATTHTVKPLPHDTEATVGAAAAAAGGSVAPCCLTPPPLLLLRLPPPKVPIRAAPAAPAVVEGRAAAGHGSAAPTRSTSTGCHRSLVSPWPHCPCSPQPHVNTCCCCGSCCCCEVGCESPR